MTEPIQTPAELPSGIVVLGLDDAGKPHASTFPPEEAELASRAAALMRFKTLPIAGPVEALAAKLPRGRVFASGKAFTPFVKAETYAALVACPGLVTPPAPEPSVEGDAPAAKPNGGKSKKAAKTEVPEPAEPAEPVHRPSSWSEVAVGSLVLASEGTSQGWWEAEVLESRGDDVFILRFWDWPDEAPFPRRRDQLGLTPPSLVELF